MATYTQANRPIRMDTPLGEDALMLTGFSGVEGTSQLFRFTLDLVSTNPAISADSLAMKPVSIRIAKGSHAPARVFHGMISRFSQGGKQGDLFGYHAELVPWLWSLTLTSDLQIFQDKTTLEIIEEVFLAHGFRDFDIRCAHTYAKREYCVQYRESHFSFVSRLMEEEGIFYFFKHEEGRHVLVLADDASVIEPLAVPVAQLISSETPSEDVITTVLHEYAHQVGRITLNDWDPLQPSFKLETTLEGSGPLEHYEYPAGYRQRELGDHFARIRLESIEAAAHVIRGAGSCRVFESGRRFKLRGHFRPDLNREYLLTQVQHTCRAGSFRTDTAAALDYKNHFVCIPHDVPFRPLQVTPRPVVRGPQTAIVMGPPGEDIWTDSHGRVKARFHWDRRDADDEKRSCWMRVASFWAGKGWGALHLPRPGHEVVVDFLEGNPDRPLITGSVYNDANRPAWGLPQQQNISGIRSRSTPDGTSESYNEIILDDTKGAERVAIHAQREFQLHTEGDELRIIDKDSNHGVTGARRVVVLGEEVEEDVVDSVWVDQGDQLTTLLKGDQLISIMEGDQITNVPRGDHTVEVGKGNQNIRIEDGAQFLEIKNGSQFVDAHGWVSLKATGMMGGGVILDGEKTVTIKAGTQIKLEVGETKIILSEAGILMEGPFIVQDALVKASTFASIVDIGAAMQATIKGNIMTEVSSPGVVKVVGSGVVIN